MKALIMKRGKHFLGIPLTLLLITFLAFLPFILSMGWGLLWSSLGFTLHEGNSAMLALEWFSVVTLPVGFVLATAVVVVSAWDIVTYLVAPANREVRLPKE